MRKAVRYFNYCYSGASVIACVTSAVVPGGLENVLLASAVTGGVAVLVGVTYSPSKPETTPQSDGANQQQRTA